MTKFDEHLNFLEEKLAIRFIPIPHSLLQDRLKDKKMRYKNTIKKSSESYSTSSSSRSSNNNSGSGGNILLACGFCLVLIITALTIVYETKRIMKEDTGYWQLEVIDSTEDAGGGGGLSQNLDSGNFKNFPYDLQALATGSFPSSNEYYLGSSFSYSDETGSGAGNGGSAGLNGGSGAGALSGSLDSGSNPALVDDVKLRRKREAIEYDEMGNRVYNVGVLMASHLGEYG